MSTHAVARVDDPDPGLDPGLVRVARAVLVALASVWLAIACHVYAGGMAPPVGVQLALPPLVAAAAYASSGRRWTVPRLGVALLGVQVLTHVLCASFSPMGSMSGGGSDLRMVALHVVGTAVSVVLLRHGEDVLWSLAQRAGLRHARVLVDRTGTLVVRRAPRVPHLVPALVGATLCARLEIRGPPA